jgi:dTDP-4-dehydrorhamnose reductase
MRLLVTGASGLLGLNLALEAARDHMVYGVVHSHPIQTTAFEVLTTDLLAPGALERVLAETQPDWVIHCAALANVDACEQAPELAWRLNAEFPGKLATAARGGARLLHVSTDAVFDGQRGAYQETDAPNPLSVYARSKLAGEQAVATADPEAIIARVNLFGWSLFGQRSLAEFFFNNLRAGNPVKGFTDVYFCPLLANHLANLFLRMLAANLHGMYHVVSSDCLTKYDFGLAVARLFGLDESLITPTSVTQGGLAAARSPQLTLRTDKLAAALGEPPPAWAEGLVEMFRLYKEGYADKLREMSLT